MLTKPAKETQHKHSTNTQKWNSKQTKEKQANSSSSNNNNNNNNNNINNLKGKFGSVARKIFSIFTTNIAILGAPHGIQKILQSETSSLSNGDHCWFRRNTRKKSCGKRQRQQQQ